VGADEGVDETGHRSGSSNRVYCRKMCWVRRSVVLDRYKFIPTYKTVVQRHLCVVNWGMM